MSECESISYVFDTCFLAIATENTVVCLRSGCPFSEDLKGGGFCIFVSLLQDFNGYLTAHLLKKCSE
jgi:hypothetical protein